MQKLTNIAGQEIALSDPVIVPPLGRFIGRKVELELCRAAWNISPDGTALLEDELPLHFRLEGPPGVGKNEIVYEIARRLNQPLYMVQGHEELTPEDLALILVPDSQRGTFRDAPLVLRASPLATAIHVGGLFFFDEINRVPERALSPLASVLDNRGTVYSALAGIHVGPNATNRSRFRFCCALNPALSEAGRGVLPEYIEERTLPAISVDYLTFQDLYAILEGNANPTNAFLQAFEKWYRDRSKKEVSVRQAETLLRYAVRLAARSGLREVDALGKAEKMVFRDTGGANDGVEVASGNAEVQRDRNEAGSQEVEQ